MPSQFRIVADIYKATLDKWAADKNMGLRDEPRRMLEMGRDAFLHCDGLHSETRDLIGIFTGILEQRSDEHKAKLREIEAGDIAPGTQDQLAKARETERESQKLWKDGENAILARMLAALARQGTEINCVMKEYVKKQELDTEKLRYITEEMPLYAFLAAVSDPLKRLSSMTPEQLLQIEYLKAATSAKVQECRDLIKRGKTLTERVRDAALVALEAPLDLLSFIPGLLSLQKTFATRNFTTDEGLAALQELVPVARDCETKLSAIVTAFRVLNGALRNANKAPEDTARKLADP